MSKLLQHKVEQSIRYQPHNRNAHTRITWDTGKEVFEAYHEESETTMYFSTEELPELIKVLQDLHNRVVGQRIRKELVEDTEEETEWEAPRRPGL